MKKYIFHSLILCWGLLLFVSISKTHATSSVYVSDSLEITLRRGPTTEHKILAILHSGQSLELLDKENGWSFVRILDGTNKDTEGWVLSRYLIKRLPWVTQVGSLKKENNSLKEKIAQFDKEYKKVSKQKRELTERLQTTAENLKKLKIDHEALRLGSSEYLKLKQELQTLKQQLTIAQEKEKKLSKEIQKFKFSQNIKWFFAGAFVLFVGWLIGLTIGRQQKKHRSSLLT